MIVGKPKPPASRKPPPALLPNRPQFARHLPLHAPAFLRPHLRPAPRAADLLFPRLSEPRLNLSPEPISRVYGSTPARPHTKPLPATTPALSPSARIFISAPPPVPLTPACWPTSPRIPSNNLPLRVAAQPVGPICEPFPPEARRVAIAPTLHADHPLRPPPRPRP